MLRIKKGLLIFCQDFRKKPDTSYAEISGMVLFFLVFASIWIPVMFCYYVLQLVGYIMVKTADKSTKALKRSIEISEAAKKEPGMLTMAQNDAEGRLSFMDLPNK